MQTPDHAIPVTVLTGFLGAGKTTVLNYILSANHGHKIALIINEFGKVGIDNQLIATTSEQLIPLSNGCVCCTVRTDLVAAIKKLFEGASFDHLIIETSGLADPSPIAQTFFNIPQLHRFVKMDAIVTVVDAEQFETQRRQSETVDEQVRAADFILLTKTDLVSPEQAAKVKKALSALNAEAMQLPAEHGHVDLSLLLDANAFNVDRQLLRKPDFLDELSHKHDDTINSCSFIFDKPFELKKLEDYINRLSSEQAVLRSKGIIAVRGQDERLIFHGVNNRFTIFLDRPWEEGEKRQSQLVFIGKKLPADKIEADLKKALS